LPALSFKNVAKSFGKTEIIRDFNVGVGDGEFLVLLGPSGCGKSTLLRMIAGLTDVTSGSISFDGDVVNDWDVRRRNVAFVFQSYALYPQMTVRQNIAFPLLMDRLHGWHHLPIVNSIFRYRLMRSAEVEEKIRSTASALGLTELLDRRPVKLSGGQRQRVALARALVREPSMYLLDEPLSNLDAKLRAQMRSEIVALHRSVGKTFVYVTHDQVEALTMATTIVVMNHGRIHQVGTPDDIYERPRDTFVATFVGSPPMNIIDGEMLLAHRSAVTGVVPASAVVSQAVFGVRPENLQLNLQGHEGLPARIEVIERVGHERMIGCRLAEAGATGNQLVFARAQNAEGVQLGALCSLRAEAAALSWFSRSTGERFDPSSFHEAGTRAG
jgi:multiple sugar transport system ATP-binding protein